MIFETNFKNYDNRDKRNIKIAPCRKKRCLLSEKKIFFFEKCISLVLIEPRTFAQGFKTIFQISGQSKKMANLVLSDNGQHHNLPSHRIFMNCFKYEIRQIVNLYIYYIYGGPTPV